MNQPLLKKVSDVDIFENQKRSTLEKVNATLTAELIIGVCSPIGSLREPVIEELEKQLKDVYGYEIERIKLSDYIKSNVEFEKLEIQKDGRTDSYVNLMRLIKGGDHLRETNGYSCLADFAITKILHDRIGREYELRDVPLETVISELKTRRKCYIIDSLKHKEELALFRSVYSSIFYLVSIFSAENERKQILLNKDLSKGEVEEIMNEDDYGNSDHGQNVRDTFVEADFFIRMSETANDLLEKKIARYLNIIFESEIVTPNVNEIAMYEAKSAAGNSSCLSRQVGAAITQENGEIISRGWNDVPRFGGNLYKDGQENDNRCFQIGYCSNDVTKDTVSSDIVDNIMNSKDLDKLIPNLGVLKSSDRDRVYKIMTDIVRRSSKVKDLIEFSRSVHAEMHAIILGSQLGGAKMIGGKLFCTTYPCHNCARHIIVAGIKEIYYIEPYKKSLCTTLHKDAITEDERDHTKVKILMYDGVAPRRYLEFFTQRGKRKSMDGKLVREEKSLKVPKSQLTLQAIPTLEIQSVHSLKDKGLL